MSTDSKTIGSRYRAIKIRNTKHAESIARDYIDDDAYLMMDNNRMIHIVDQLIPWVVDPNVLYGLAKIKEVVNHKITESWR